MRRLLLLVAAMIGVTALLAGCSSSEGATVSTVPADEFVASMTEPGTVIVDVRTPAEYAAGHVDGAINIDVEGGTFGTEIEALTKDTTYALYCRSGRRSAIAADQMEAAGFTSILNLQGGLADLQVAGAPVVAG